MVTLILILEWCVNQTHTKMNVIKLGKEEKESRGDYSFMKLHSARK